MAISIHSNPSAATAAVQLSKNVAAHQTSLERLSSGSRIAKPSDDAGGNAVAMKMASAIRRTNAVSTNVSNALSFLQTQEAGLRQFSSILTRMSELTVFMQDVTKSEADLNNYVTEMSVLCDEMEKIQSDRFNGVRLFHTAGTPEPLQVYVSEDASQVIELDQSNLGALVFQNIIAFSNSIASIDAREEFNGLTLDAYRTALQEIATLIGQNGAAQSRINFALSGLSANGTNLEASLSRIADVDVATESTRLAKTKVLAEFSATVLQQANANANIATKLISGS
jgi:flagellin